MEPFRTPAVKELRGHQDDIFDLSWSGNLFLLSASRDKTVVLWHLYSDAALKTFRYCSAQSTAPPCAAAAVGLLDSAPVVHADVCPHAMRVSRGCNVSA